MVTLSFSVAILAAIAILQVGVVLGMWLKTAFGAENTTTVPRHPHKLQEADE